MSLLNQFRSRKRQDISSQRKEADRPDLDVPTTFVESSIIAWYYCQWLLDAAGNPLNKRHPASTIIINSYFYLPFQILFLCHPGNQHIHRDMLEMPQDTRTEIQNQQSGVTFDASTRPPRYSVVQLPHHCLSSQAHHPLLPDTYMRGKSHLLSFCVRRASTSFHANAL